MRKRVCPVYYDRWDYRRREGLNWKVERAILDGSGSRLERAVLET